MHLGKLVSLGPIVKFELFLDSSSKVFIHREAALQAFSLCLNEVHQDARDCCLAAVAICGEKTIFDIIEEGEGHTSLERPVKSLDFSPESTLAVDKLDSLVSHTQECDLVLDYIVKDILIVYVGHLAIVFRNLAKQYSRDCWEVTRCEGIFGKNGRAARDESVQDSHEQLVGKRRSDWIRRVVDHQAQRNRIFTTLRLGNMQLGNWERDCDVRDAPPSR